MELSELSSRVMRWRAASARFVSGAAWLVILAAVYWASALRYGRRINSS